MNLKDIIQSIRNDNNHTNEDIRVATFLFNLGLKFVFNGKKIKNESGIIGDIDLCFIDEEINLVFLIEVSRQNKNSTSKVDHFFSKWSNKNNLISLKQKYQFRSNSFIKINFDLFPRNEQEEFKNKPSLSHIVNEQNILIGLNDFNYFEKCFEIINKWAINDFYDYLGVNSDSSYTRKTAIPLMTGKIKSFVFVDNVTNILKYSYISRKRDNELGYQRMVEQARIGSILKTIKKGETITFPNSIILNSKEKLEIKDNLNGTVDIEIPNGYCKFRVVDGQHRLMGFAKMGDFNRENYSLPIVIFDNLEKSKEIQTFIEINHKQKRLDSNLILSLKADFDWEINDIEYFEKISVLIAKKLNENSELKNNIFFGYADEKKGDKVTVTTLHSSIKKNNFIGTKIHLFQKNPEDLETPFNRIKELLSLVGKVFKNEKSFFYTNLGIRILFKYVQLFERNKLKEFIVDISFEDNLKDLKNAFNLKIIDEIKENYGEGGADNAVQILVEKLKEFDDKYLNFETDLRKLKN